MERLTCRWNEQTQDPNLATVGPVFYQHLAHWRSQCFGTLDQLSNCIVGWLCNEETLTMDDQKQQETQAAQGASIAGLTGAQGGAAAGGAAGAAGGENVG